MSVTPTSIKVAARRAAGLDFEADVMKQLRDRLVVSGYPESDLLDFGSLARRCANVDFRRITQRPRTFVMPTPPFAIPPPLLQGFTALKLAVERGADLTPNQSTLRLNADYHDPLLSDWGVHHFHLGVGPHPTVPGFVKRTGPLLFALTSETHFFALGIDQHGAWEDIELLEVAHRNWPALLAHHRVEGKVTNALRTSAEVKAFRKVGINGAVELSDGTVYGWSGGGMTADGTPVKVARAATLLVAEVRRLEREVFARLDEFRAKLSAETGLDPATFGFRLAMVRRGEDREPGFWLDDPGGRYRILIQPH